MSSDLFTLPPRIVFLKFQCIVVLGVKRNDCRYMDVRDRDANPQQNRNPIHPNVVDFALYITACSRTHDASQRSRRRAHHSYNATKSDDARARSRSNARDPDARTCATAAMLTDNARSVDVSAASVRAHERGLRRRSAADEATSRRIAAPRAEQQKRPALSSSAGLCSPEQIRTAVTALRGRRPRPLDDGAGCRIDEPAARGGGLEPPMTGPEPVVLPITPPPKVPPG